MARSPLRRHRAASGTTSKCRASGIHRDWRPDLLSGPTRNGPPQSRSRGPVKWPTAHRCFTATGQLPHRNSVTVSQLMLELSTRKGAVVGRLHACYCRTVLCWCAAWPARQTRRPYSHLMTAQLSFLIRHCENACFTSGRITTRLKVGHAVVRSGRAKCGQVDPSIMGSSRG